MKITQFVIDRKIHNGGLLTYISLYKEMLENVKNTNLFTKKQKARIYFDLFIKKFSFVDI